MANLLWAGNWVTGRALREGFEPFTLSFWRWFLAALVLAPFALPRLAGKAAILRRHLGLLVLLGLTGASLFQSLVYLGLQTTTAINGVLLNSSGPVFMLLCSWILERERSTARQIAGLLISLAGILIIVSEAEPAKLLHLELHPGDGWILLAMPIWGVYSVLLKRRPPGIDGVALLFVISALGAALLVPGLIAESLRTPPRWPSRGEAAGVVYVALAASVAGFICWNRGVALVGASTAGFTMHLLPAFGTLLAIVFLGEAFHAYHAVGIATILAGVVLATRPRAAR
jgi:drug/metabolite transporter (DMT)-like permease